MLDGLSLGKTVATAAPPDVLVAIPGSTGAAICITRGYDSLMTANSVYHSDSERLELLLVDQESAESEKGPESKKGNFYSW